MKVRLQAIIPLAILLALFVVHLPDSSTSTSLMAVATPAPPYTVPTEAQPMVDRLGIPASELSRLHIVVSSDLSACGGGDSAAPDSCFAPPNTLYMTSHNIATHNQWQNNALFAHEYLHYVWSTMTPRQQTDLAPYITEVYHQHAAYLNQRLSGYKVSDQMRLNELHSFIGTEIDDWELPLPLMQHYQHYIPNRGALPSFE